MNPSTKAAHDNERMNAPVSNAVHGITRLSDWGVIRAQGPEAAAFLQGQLTQDMLHIEPTQARLAGYCSAKGRLLATFVVWRAAPDELLLACSADLLPATLKRLSMFVLRAKCKLSDASAELSLYGVLGENWAPAPWKVAATAGGQAIRLPDAQGVSRHLLALPADASAPALPALNPNDWLACEVASAVPRVVAATAEQFVPQMVNLELAGGVNFQKGCYPGQEVVARSQYRGTLKRRAQLFAVAGAAQPGQEIFHASDPEQPAGMVVLAAAQPGRVLAEVKLAALDGGSLHLGSAQGAVLERLPMPYDVPREQT
jgi:tRNA-modifying protein YgfZ